MLVKHHYIVRNLFKIFTLGSKLSKKTIRKKIENGNIFSSFLIQTTDKQKTVTNGKFQHNFRLDSSDWIFFLTGIVLF